MSKPPSPQGSITDLYEAMQQRESGAPTPTVTQPAEQERTRARVPAPTPASTAADQQVALVDALYRGLQHKHHLASQTFRFQPGELEELDALVAQLGQRYPRTVSKNDLVRLGLNWLLQDYAERGDDSMLARVLARL